MKQLKETTSENEANDLYHDIQELKEKVQAIEGRLDYLESLLYDLQEKIEEGEKDVE